MNFGFDDSETCTVSIKLGNQIIDNRTMSMPFIILEQQCRSLVNSIANDTRPMQVKFSTKQFIEQKNEWRDAYLIFSNNSYLNEFPDEE